MGHGILGARVAVDPQSYNVWTPPGSVKDTTLTIGNTGGLDLNFQIGVTIGDRLFMNHWPTAAEIRASLPNINDINKNSPAPSYPPMILDQGGPDAFGYLWMDSNEPAGPTYNWVDISSFGFPLYMSDDDNQGPFALGFSFPYYGQNFNDVRICSNGWISFTSFSGQYYNYPLPDVNSPENMIAAFWDDLYPPTGGVIYYYAGSDSFIVQWQDIYHINGYGPFTFEIILTSDGQITYQYLYIGSEFYDCTVGIQNGDYTIGLLISYNQPYLADNLAIRINRGWLTVDTYSGVVFPESSVDIGVTMNAESLAEGDYNGSISVDSWDVNHSEPLFNVPVLFHVTTSPPGCQYVPGDANGNGTANGLDVGYSVNWLKGGPLAPPNTCDCPPNGVIYAAADANGNCSFNGLDVTYLVNFLKGSPLAPTGCDDCPPALLVNPSDDIRPAVEPIKAPTRKTAD
jgi:hypothetical protein